MWSIELQWRLRRFRELDWARFTSRHRLHLVHASLDVPADVAAHDVVVLVAAETLEGVGRPLVVADGELVAPGQGAVLDQQTADVGVGAVRSWQVVQFVVGDRRRRREIFEEGGDVGLSDPGHSAVGSLHRFQCSGYRAQLGGHHARAGIDEQLIDEHCEFARPALGAAVELVLGAAGGAVDVERDAGASSAGRLAVDAAGQDAVVAAAAGATGSLGLLVAVAAHVAVGPVGRDLVVLTAAGAGEWPPGWIAWLSRPSHPRRP